MGREWLSVRDHPPGEGRILVVREIGEARYVDVMSWVSDPDAISKKNVTLWMPLPEPGTETPDIVSRLASWTHSPSAESACDLMDEAAEEIKTLRARLTSQSRASRG